MVGRVTASAIASASRLSFLFDLTYGFTNWGAMSLTSWPWARKQRAQSCAPPQASIPMRTGGSFAIQGIRSWRDNRLRYTTLPCHPFLLRETRALRYRSRGHASRASWDLPPVAQWVH